MQVTVGAGHGCLLSAAGDVWCWGENKAGQLGDGFREPQPKPVKVASGVVSVAAGEGFTCAVEQGGRVRCWGALPEPMRGPDQAEVERACQAGEGGVECQWLAAAKALQARIPNKKRFRELMKQRQAAEARERSTPRVLSPPITNAVSIAAGGDSACALDRAGRATCFMYAAPGTSAHSIWGRERMAKPKLIRGVGRLVEVAPGALKTCGRTSAGKVFCWDEAEGPKEVTGISDATSLAMTIETACASLANGEVHCWPTRYDEAPKSVPGLRQVTELRGGGRKSFCALTKDRQIFCWGRLGSEWFAERGGSLELESPERIRGASGSTALAVGYGHACAMAPDGVRCWGSATRGALGDGTLAEATAPVAVSLGENAIDVAAAGSASCAVLASGQVRCWGAGYGQDATFGGEGAAIGLVPGVVGASRVFAGDQGACALVGGTITCWHHAERPRVARPVPTIADAIAVAPDSSTVSCAARASGETACWWGGGEPAPLPGVRDLVELAYGAYDWSCGRTKAGRMVCWSMPLHLPAAVLPAPKLAAIPNVGRAVSVTTTAFRACAARADGSVVCTGSMSTPHKLRKLTGFANVVQLDASNTGTIGSLLCARTRSGEALCQGWGRWGELGTGRFTPPPYPHVAPAKGIDDASDVAVGEHHACALRKTGEVWCWGSDTLGEVSGVARGVRRCARPIHRP